VLFLPEFPLTATGKVQRFRLREHALEQLTAGAGPAVRQGEPA
jgi:acyl-coenzyme A synthetase/AMP-(fatty) acid ligase